MEQRTYYSILGLNPHALPEQIDQAYQRQLARPDLDEEEFQALAEAYNALGDAETRRAYDEFLHGFEDPAEDPSAALDSSGLHQIDLELDFAEACLGVQKTLDLEDGPLSFTVPAGSKDGDRLPFKGGVAWLKVLPHPVYYYLEDGPLAARLKLDFSTAALGGQVTLPRLEGGNYQISIEAGTRDLQSFDFEGLRFVCHVHTPTQLNQRQKEILRELERSSHAA